MQSIPCVGDTLFIVDPSFSYLPRVLCWGPWSAPAPCSSGQWGSHCPDTGTGGTDSSSPCTAPSPPLLSHSASWHRSPSSLWRGTAELRIVFGGDTDPSAHTPPKRLELLTWKYVAMKNLWDIGKGPLLAQNIVHEETLIWGFIGSIKRIYPERDDMVIVHT